MAKPNCISHDFMMTVSRLKCLNNNCVIRLDLSATVFTSIQRGRTLTCPTAWSVISGLPLPQVGLCRIAFTVCNNKVIERGSESIHHVFFCLVTRCMKKKPPPKTHTHPRPTRAFGDCWAGLCRERNFHYPIPGSITFWKASARTLKPLPLPNCPAPVANRSATRVGSGTPQLRAGRPSIAFHAGGAPSGPALALLLALADRKGSPVTGFHYPILVPGVGFLQRSTKIQCSVPTTNDAPRPPHVPSSDVRRTPFAASRANLNEAPSFAMLGFFASLLLVAVPGPGGIMEGVDGVTGETVRVPTMF